MGEIVKIRDNNSNQNYMNDKKNVTGAVMVVGAGIAGIQASLDLADSGYLVHLVESQSAIGGVMAQLDKTFPTNDCAMCVISPKLVEAGRHLNIDLHTMSDIVAVAGQPGNFEVTLRQRPRFIDLDKCTACGECAKVCPIDVPNLFDQKLRDRKAAFKLYPQGMPSAYAIDKRGTAPCKATCPAHVSIQGYIALINKGKYREALALFKAEHPFPGVCGRVCHHPCEQQCTRNDVDAPLAIRELHRFLADIELVRGDQFIPEIENLKPDKVAIVGSGPSGLSAAYFLALKGYPVTVFERLPVAGGMMAVGIPEYRLPRKVLAQEIEVIEKMGVVIKTNVTFGRDITLESLKQDGFAALYIAVGLHGGRQLGVENENMPGVLQGVDYLRDVALGKEVVVGDEILVIGGGNVAIDVALTAKRKGAGQVTLICLEKREEMPAWEHEIKEALEGDIRIVNSFGPKRFMLDADQKVSGIEFKTCTAVFNAEGRFDPIFDEDQCQAFFADTVIIAIGQSLETGALPGILLNERGGIKANPDTLQTSKEWVFAGGDAFYGPKSVVEAVACGKQGAENIDRYITGRSLTAARVKNPEFVKPSVENIPETKRTLVRCLDPAARQCNFLEVSYGFNEAEACQEAGRCLKCGICSECYQCVDACLAKAIDHKMPVVEKSVRVGSIILAPGFKPFDPSLHKSYHYAHHPNIVTSLEFERILSASGPYQGHLVRPLDNRKPQKIAWLQCVGSRDNNQCDHGYCSSVCCMYAVKQAVIAKEHSTNDLETSIFYMDLRTFGKDFDRYQLRASEEKGVRFIRSRPHTIDPIKDGRLRMRYLTESGRQEEDMYDMVVLSIGISPIEQAVALAQKLGIELNPYRFALTKSFTPVTTNKDGIYVCGAFQGPKDIPSSVMEASAAASEATLNLAKARFSMTRIKEVPPETDICNHKPRIGVFVCNCGINIGGIADVPAVRDYAKTLAHVVHVEDNLFTCSQDTQEKIKQVIIEKNINRVVVASCSPRTHEPLFQETIRDAGLNPYLFEMANIRDQNTWVHMTDPDKATEKAKTLVRMAVAKAGYIEPLYQVTLDVKQAALIVGGGVAGMEAALSIAGQGFQSYLVERLDRLGGVAHGLTYTWQGEDISVYLRTLIEKVLAHPNINVLLNAEITETSGIIGNFRTQVLEAKNGIVSRTIAHGATILATGGHEYVPTEYLYGQHPGVLTHLDLDNRMAGDDPQISASKITVFIQCVGSRNSARPYCSRVCCTHSLKSALSLKEQNPVRQIYILYRDMRSYGFREDLYKQARQAGIVFIRYDQSDPPQLTRTGQNRLCLTITDHILCQPLEMEPDLIVLAAAVIPYQNQELYEQFKVPVNADGFLVEAHAKLRPVDFASEGIFLAGLAHNPKPIDETIAQAKAAASRAVVILSKERIQAGGVVAELAEPDRCARCLVCVRTCPYNVPYVKDGRARIEPAKCHGCGMCAAECPAKVITLRHFTDRQIQAKTGAMLSISGNQ